MARRKKTRSRRRNRGISILGASEALLMGSAIFRGLFNNSIGGFFMPGTLGEGGTIAWHAQGAQTMTGPYGAGDVVTLSEFWGTGSGNSQPVSTQIMNNIKTNGMQMFGSLILIPLAFRVGKRLAAPAINQTNRLLRDVGVASVVKV